MKYRHVMQCLKQNGTAQNRKIYCRHGAGNNKMYGVSYKVLGHLKKQIKMDHKLAKQLWDTKNLDAQVLGLMVADSNVMCESCFETWQKDIRTQQTHILSNQIGNLLATSPVRDTVMEKWMKSKQEYDLNSAYSTLSATLRLQVPISITKCKKYIKQIEKQIRNAPNRGKSAMNWALIAIGTYKLDLTKEAIAAAKRIGTVEIDHGDTSCKTPDAVPYIKKASMHYREKLKKSKIKLTEKKKKEHKKINNKVDKKRKIKKG